jgi:hypothetical protein
MNVPRLTIEEYGALCFELAQLSEKRGAAYLVTCEFTEETWREEAAYWEANLERALGMDTDDLPDLLAQYSRGLEKARARRIAHLVPLDQYLAILGEMMGGRPLGEVLARKHVNLATFLASQVEWTQKAQQDASLRALIERALSGQR